MGDRKEGWKNEWEVVVYDVNVDAGKQFVY